jgi:hypothetical protein
MITIMPQSEGNVVCVQASEKLTDEDYRRVWIPALEKAIREHGRARALLYMDRGFRGWQVTAMWDDAAFGLKHTRHLAKVATVGGPKYVQWATRIGQHFLPGCEVETFPEDKLADAITWIKS